MAVLGRRFFVTVLALTGLIAPPPAFAQARAMTIVDWLNLPRISDPQLAPNGQDVVYVLTRADWKQNKRVGHIWRARAGAQPVQLTTGENGESSPRWSPDGKSISFVAKRDKDEFAQIYILPTEGGEARVLTAHKSEVSNTEWSPDGAAIFFTAPEPKSAAEQDREKLKDDIYPFDEDYKQTHLWKVVVASKAESRLTDGDYSVRGYELSRDGKAIALHRGLNPLVGSADASEVWMMDANGANPRPLTKNAVSESGAKLSPDNARVLFLSGSNQQFETYYNSKLFVVPASGGTARVVTPADAPYEVLRADWSADGRSIYFVANMGVHSELFVMPAEGGTPRQVTTGTHSLEDWSVGSDRHVFTINEPTSPGDVYVMSSATASASRVTDVFGRLAEEFKLPRQEAIQWKGADGVTVEGLLFYPADYQPGRKYPLAVQTHGGPQATDRYGFSGWNYYVPVLTGKGYAVLQPNYRGSTGYGDGFLRDMVGHYFQNAHLDVIAGTDELIRRGVADPERLVKMGWSAGGHMTNKIITFTDRFKAASSGAGAADWVSMYAQSDTRIQRTPWFGGTPWQANAPIANYWDNSPLKDVAKVKTPTLFLVGDKDARVPMPQSIEMYRALKSNGVPTRLYIAPREPHGWTELRHQLYKINVELEWFEKYALGRSYVWEKAPAVENDPKPSTN
jgi:dipeptidyl aminopeptidase/acylaminoacyl peptidase